MPIESVIDLRSDTVTKPSPGMRKAMAEAEVGDDVFGDDPTVQRLEALVAEMLGKEAALFVASGTMANQVALHTASNRGDEVLCGTDCHIVNYEVAAPAVLSGLMVHPLPDHKGVLSAETVANTTGIALDTYASYFDSVSVCLSKGLGAPVGSLITGTKEFIEKARRTRKMFGGGMRQVGILAAAGIYALEHNISRLVDDHANARYLAEQFSKMPGLVIDLETVQSNIVIVTLDPHTITVDDFVRRLKDRGVLCVPFGGERVRFVPNLDTSDADCRRAAQEVAAVLGA
jgi:threonine aldolase